MPYKPRKTNWRQLLIGLVALLIGLLLYIYDRPANQVALMPEMISQYEEHQGVFGQLGYSLPALLHVFAFSLLTAGILGSVGKEARIICAAWAMVNLFFEIGQHPRVAEVLVPMIPNWFSFLPVLDNLASFFTQGRYDVIDMLFIIVGAVLAVVVIHITSTKTED